MSTYEFDAPTNIISLLSFRWCEEAQIYDVQYTNSKLGIYTTITTRSLGEAMQFVYQKETLLTLKNTTFLLGNTMLQVDDINSIYELIAAYVVTGELELEEEDEI